MAEQVRLEDLIPARATFTLKSRPGIEYALRPMDLNDQVWIKKTFGNQDALQVALQGMDVEAVTRMVYHQLEQSSRKDFVATTESQVDDDGNEVTRTITGPEKLRAELSWPQEFMGLVTVLLKTIGLSQPILDKLQIEAVKKNEVKEAETSPTGEKYSTSSPANKVTL